MKKILILSVLILCVASFVHGVSPTKYSVQNILNMAFTDSDGNPLAFATKLSAQNVLNLSFDDITNTINAKIVGELVISTMSGIVSIYWLDGSTWTSTKINMGAVSLEYTNYQIVINTDTWVMGDFFWGAPGTKSTATAEGNLTIHLNLTVQEHTYTSSLTVGTTAYHGDNITMADGKLVDGVDISNLETIVEELASSTLVLYYTNEPTSSGDYLLMTATIPTGAESTLVGELGAAIVIVTSFTVETPLTLSALRKGLYHSHFHAEVDSTVKTTRLRFEVYKGTSAANTFLFSSEQSNILTTSKAAYDIHVSTDEILGTVGYVTVRIVADVTGAGANPVLTFYMEGDNSSVFEMPALLSDVGVTKIIAGTDIDITSTDNNGRGEVTINSDALPKSSGTIIEAKIANVESSTGPLVYQSYDGTNSEVDIATNTHVEGDLIVDGDITNDDFRSIDDPNTGTFLSDETWAAKVGNLTGFKTDIQTADDYTWRNQDEGLESSYDGHPGKKSTTTLATGDVDWDGDFKATNIETKTNFICPDGTQFASTDAFSTGGATTVYKDIPLYVPGDAYITNGIDYRPPLGYDMTITTIVVSVSADGTMPSGTSDLNFDIQISTGGSEQNTFYTIFNTTYSLQIASGTCWGQATTSDLAVTELKRNYVIRLDITAVCGTYPGGDPILGTIWGTQN